MWSLLRNSKRLSSKGKLIAKIPWVEGSQSQLGQESFVLWILNNKIGGYFLEIGAYDAFELSNTFKLEEIYHWRGIALEIDPERSSSYSTNRESLCLNVDALKIEYDAELRKYGAPAEIDFLQIDIEPPKNSFIALRKVLSSKFSFNVVTFEHDLYASHTNYVWKFAAFTLLRIYGFQRCVNNVSNGSARQEDWYVHRRLKTGYRGPSNESYHRIFDKIPK